MFIKKNIKQRLAVIALTVLCLLVISKMLFRPYWYDEALTILEFVGQKGYYFIYSHYEIPNNHIIFNCLVMAWIRLWQNFFPITELSFRLVSFFGAVFSIVIIAVRWRRRFGTIAWLLCLSLLLSLPMLIYGTAIRGYMLSFLLILIALESAIQWRDKGSYKALVIYSVSALLALGTVPTNLLAFAAINLLPDRPLTKKNIFSSRRLCLAIIPIAALIVFYLPIAEKLLNAINLRDGWPSSLAAIWHLYGGFLINLLPLVIVGFAGFCINLRRKQQNIWSIIGAGAIWILPALVMLIRQPAPFPRVFFSYWPIWLYLLAMSGRHFIAWLRQSTGLKKMSSIMTIIIMLALLYGSFLQNMPWIPAVICNPAKGDDFCYPYYMKRDFRPKEACKTVVQLTEGMPEKIFLSQGCDYPSIIMYGKTMMVDEKRWIFDRPLGQKLKKEDLPDVLLVITKGEVEAKRIAQRFQFAEINPVRDVGYQKIYLLK